MPKTVKNPKHKTQTQTQNLTPKPKPKPKTLIRFKILLNLIIKKFLSHFYFTKFSQWISIPYSIIKIQKNCCFACSSDNYNTLVCNLWNPNLEKVLSDSSAAQKFLQKIIIRAPKTRKKMLIIFDIIIEKMNASVWGADRRRRRKFFEILLICLNFEVNF